jgi:hypothetical protein
MFERMLDLVTLALRAVQLKTEDAVLRRQARKLQTSPARPEVGLYAPKPTGGAHELARSGS